ncbi:uncharacterized protein N0V89_009935 [Didymosphaeria variabile]|uniref:J domain-containing protein n=1 Tax=Didymosphaeria variabile TaxID=1932322 RepID=A0A9W8XEA1_9PLEO|nr:uncharacterized protein N0V89_009935 [Didymosphaeria variabile]KAJ4348558.1 hypothetical protein N0V89_009935 [Didymosphaeria variabile]
MSNTSPTRDFYADLGLTRDATAKEIKAAFHRLAKVHHPDKQGSASEFRKVHEAYEALRDTSSEDQYDEKMRKQRETAYNATRPSNAFNPRPRAPNPANVPRQTSAYTRPNENARYNDVGSEFEEEQPASSSNTYRHTGSRYYSQGQPASSSNAHSESQYYSQDHTE